MYDKKLMILDILNEIENSIKMILRRFETIDKADDFLFSDDNIERLDGISMRLIAIGEGCKDIDKMTDKKLLLMYPSINWKNIKGIRDILSHHYFDVNANIIFMICDEKLPELLVVIKKIISDLNLS